MKKFCFVFIACILLFVFNGCASENNDSAGVITVIVINFEKQEVFNGNIAFTEQDTLLGLLQNHEDIMLSGEEQSYGYFIKEVCGVNSDDYPQTFWFITVNDEDPLKGISDIPLKDGDTIALQLINW